MNTVKLYSVKSHTLTENGQTKLIRFALLQKISGDLYKNIMPMVKCRDYFNDIVYEQATKGQFTFSIYGFRWKFSPSIYKQQQEGNDLKMLMSSPVIQYNMFLLEQFCKETNLPLPQIEECEVTEGDCKPSYDCKYYIVTFNSIFLNNGPLMSLFTLLLRCSFYDNMEGLYDQCSSLKEGISCFLQQNSADCSTDSGLLYTIDKHYEHFIKFLESPSEKQFVDPEDNIKYNNHSIHDHTGIQSFTNDLYCKFKEKEAIYFNNVNLHLLTKVLG